MFTLQSAWDSCVGWLWIMWHNPCLDLHVLTRDSQVIYTLLCIYWIILDAVEWICCVWGIYFWHVSWWATWDTPHNAGRGKKEEGVVRNVCMVHVVKVTCSSWHSTHTMFAELRRMNARQVSIHWYYSKASRRTMEPHVVVTAIQVALQVLNILTVISTALMIWKALGLTLNTESPIVVVLR